MPITAQTVSNEWSEGVTVIVPTFQRPDGIKVALASLSEQTAQGRALEILVADNDPNGGAKDRVLEIAKRSKNLIRYIHVPDPGVSNARNAAMAEARGRYIAFLDDDMEALPGWLESLLATSQKLDAALVFGPAEASMPNPQDPRNIYLAPFFSRIARTSDEALMSETLGTGGCLVDRSKCELPDPPFDTDLNETGGEDDIFFSHIIRAGGDVAWSPQARAYEHVPENRATDAYIWKRNFAFGQGPVQIALQKGLTGIPVVARHMAVGMLQLIIYGTLYIGFKSAGHPKYVNFMAKTAQALGKLLWSDALSPKLYGVSQLKDNPVG